MAFMRSQTRARSGGGSGKLKTNGEPCHLELAPARAQSTPAEIPRALRLARPRGRVLLA